MSLNIKLLNNTVCSFNWTRVRAVAVVLLCAQGANAGAQDLPKQLTDGWEARLRLAGEATTGTSRTSTFSLDASGAYRRGRFGTELDARFLRRSTELEVERTDAEGQTIIEADGDPSVERVSQRLNDRRFLSVEPRWYLMNDVVFLFGLFDIDRDRPTGVDLSTREVLGVGYRLWADKKNFLTAGIGAGHKRLVTTDDETSDSGIGYLGIKLSLETSERTRLRSELASDFGGDNGSTEFSISFGVDVVDGVELLVSYDARVYDDVGDDVARTDNLDGRAVIGLAVELP